MPALPDESDVASDVTPLVEPDVTSTDGLLAPDRDASLEEHRAHAEDVLTQDEFTVKPDDYPDEFDEPPHD